MRSTWTVCCVGAVLFTVVPGVRAEIKGELIGTRMIWDRGARNLTADLVRFKERWYVVCQESTGAHTQDGALRVLSSKDGMQWESAALLFSPTPHRGLSRPRFSTTPDGQLVISATGIVPSTNLQAQEPVPMWGGTLMTLAWYSRDGRKWNPPDQIGVENFPFRDLVWNDGTAWSYARGTICGSMQTVRFLASKDGKQFETRFLDTYSGFFPENAAILFDGRKAHCLMGRVGSTVGNPRQAGWLGTAEAPFMEWKWKELEARIANPALLPLPDGRTLAAVGLTEGKARISLCAFDAAKGKLTEFLELPTSGTMQRVGLAYQEGQVWAAYHAVHRGKWSIHLARVKLK